MSEQFWGEQKMAVQLLLLPNRRSETDVCFVCGNDRKTWRRTAGIWTDGGKERILALLRNSDVRGQVKWERDGKRKKKHSRLSLTHTKQNQTQRETNKYCICVCVCEVDYKGSVQSRHRLPPEMMIMTLEEVPTLKFNVISCSPAPSVTQGPSDKAPVASTDI